MSQSGQDCASENFLLQKYGLYSFTVLNYRKEAEAPEPCERKGMQHMNKKIRTEAVDHLFQAILTLKDPEECYVFFEDVCTVNELLSLSQRYEVAKMLREKKTYLEIAEKTGASTATISRVNRSLNYGNDGYDMVFSRLESGEDSGE